MAQGERIMGEKQVSRNQCCVTRDKGFEKRKIPEVRSQGPEEESGILRSKKENSAKDNKAFQCVGYAKVLFDYKKSTNRTKLSGHPIFLLSKALRYALNIYTLGF